MQPIKSILTPVDFSDNAEKIVKAAAYVAGTFQAELHLVFVAQTFEDYSGFLCRRSICRTWKKNCSPQPSSRWRPMWRRINRYLPMPA